MPRIPLGNINSAPKSSFGPATAAKVPSVAQEGIKMGDTLMKIGDQITKKANEAEYVEWETSYNTELSKSRRQIKVAAQKMDDEGNYEEEILNPTTGEPIVIQKNIEDDLSMLRLRESELKAKGDSLAYSNRAKKTYSNVQGQHTDRAEYAVEMKRVQLKAKKSYDGLQLEFDFSKEKVEQGEPDPLEVDALFKKYSVNEGLWGADAVKQGRRTQVEDFIGAVARGISSSGESEAYKRTAQIVRANATPAQKMRLDKALEKAGQQYKVKKFQSALKGVEKFESAMKTPQGAAIAAQNAPKVAKNLLEAEPVGDFAPPKFALVEKAATILSQVAYRDSSTVDGFYTPELNEDGSYAAPSGFNAEASKQIKADIEELVADMGLSKSEAAVIKKQTYMKAEQEYIRARVDPALMIETDSVTAGLMVSDPKAGFDRMNDLYKQAGVSPTKRTYFSAQVGKTFTEQLNIMKQEGNLYGPRVETFLSSAGPYRDTLVSNLVEANKAPPAMILFDKMNPGYAMRLGSAVHAITEQKGYNGNVIQEKAGISMAAWRTSVGSAIKESEIALPAEFAQGSSNKAFNKGIRQSIEALAYANLEVTGGDAEEAIELAVSEFKENVATFANAENRDALVLPRSLIKNDAEFEQIKRVVESPRDMIIGLYTKEKQGIDFETLKSVYKQSGQDNTTEYLELERISKMKRPLEQAARFSEVFEQNIIMKNDPEDSRKAGVYFRTRTLDMPLRFENGTPTVSVDELRGLAPVGERRVTIEQINDTSSYIEALERRLKSFPSGAGTDAIRTKLQINNAKRDREALRKKRHQLDMYLGVEDGD